MGAVDGKRNRNWRTILEVDVKAIAYWHGPERIHKLALAFAAGCRVHGVDCDVLPVDEDGGDADLVWMYGLGEGAKPFARHVNAVRVVGDKGYFAGYPIEKHFRISINAQQPDLHLNLRSHPADRFNSLGLNVEPVTKRGEYVLLCGIGRKQCSIKGLSYGEWERGMYARLREITDRKIIVREKPKNPPIGGVPSSKLTSVVQAIRGAWAVVCLTGNIGADAILHGVPVIAESGPGAVYYRADLEHLESIVPLSAEHRLAALSDIAYCQWRRDELSSGALFGHLRVEGWV
jgi:hypothetical protein